MNDTGTKNMDDLASLFLPDILHPLQSSSNTPGASTSNPSNQSQQAQQQQEQQLQQQQQQSPQQGNSSVVPVKSEEFDTLSADFNLLHRDSITSSNTPPTSSTNTGNNNVTNFSDFLHNNNFINNNANSSHLMNQSFNSPLSAQSLTNNNTGGANLDAIDQSLQTSQQQQGAHLHHYGNYMNFEQNGGMMHHYQHHQQLMSMYGPQYQQIYQNQPPPQHQPQQQVQSQQPQQQSQISQQQQQQQLSQQQQQQVQSQQSQGQFNNQQNPNPQQMFQQSSMNASASTTFLNNYPFARTPNAGDWYDGLLGNGTTASNPNVYNQSSSMQFPRTTDISGFNQPYDQQSLASQQGSFNNLQQQPGALPEQAQQQPTSQQPELNESNDSSPNLVPKKKKLKAKKIKDIISSEYQIDYKPSKLRQLLDFKRVENTMKRKDYKIVDKDNNNINIDFNGFLNGRFITNDNDNIYYLLTKKKTDNEHDKPNSKETTIKEDPKVISCYRRNYISVAINMNINGFKNSKSKLLKLQTSEYGYTITRVIKYFKIEISANISNKGNVPIFIKGKKMKDKKTTTQPPVSSGGANSYEFKDDLVQPSYINSREHIVILNDETAIENGQIDNYFIVKKIQFKNATPNNGNLAFQNYYHFKVKFSCVVADLYYDDYVDDELNNGLNGNTSNQNAAGNAGVGDNNEITLFELVSEPITVRGRNPSFYAERKDVTIKGRSNTSKKSFKRAGRSGLTNNNNEEDEDDYDYHGDDLKDHDGDDGDEDDEDDDEPSSANANRDNSPNSSSAEDEPNNGKPGKGDEQNQGSGDHQLQQQLQGDQISGQVTNPPLSPLAYTSTQSAIDLKSVNRYKYFPISNVYYLPPINVVYFPHRAHQYQQGQIEDVTAQEEEAVTNERRKSSNVYFK
ncbi:hypothetical protein DFJ63DRAFT_337602 [Scheffersomyces coipomensis]|uniref:uncharacterized protein n=1 Tax=Scheffersomyces coipomensis TaxID=1788519 RepID=UPI00315D0E11